MKNILLVSLFDDNFGDNIIRIDFEHIFRVVLDNLNIKDYQISKMNLKEIEYEKINKSDLIIFCGGGLFGLSYLNFFEYLEKIINRAEKLNIPVLFSSIGINNMDATEENENKLRNILKKKCIKGIAVRENIDIFKYYLGSRKLLIKETCDPGCWAKYVYNIEKKSNKKPVIGINVVRGGLFKDNKRDYSPKREFEFLNSVREYLDSKKWDYYFYTNGSVLDDNALKWYVEENDIPVSKVIKVNTTKELVNTIAKFDKVIAMRMHSSIISYALETPSINMIWNDKLVHFYKNIGYPDRAVEIENWNLDTVKEFLELKEEYNHSNDYLMSLYDYLYEIIPDIFKIKNTNKKYNFSEVVKHLYNQTTTIEDDLLDYDLKMKKYRENYYARFKENQELKAANKELTKENTKLTKENKRLNKIFIIRVGRRIKRFFRRFGR